MKYYLICGETSGDIHAANLVKGLKRYDNQAQIRAWGGDSLIAQGVEVVKHIRDLSFMGLVEVLLNLKTIKRNFKFAYNDILAYSPDVLILVDFPGFNLRLAKWAKKKGIKVFYYISPTVWAWHQSRVSYVRDYVDKMFVILPFEKDFYKRFNIDVDYEGHPIMDALAPAMEKAESRAEFCARHQLDEKPMIAILPGSRKQELIKILKIMTSVAGDFKDYNFVVAGLSFLPKELYADALKTPNVRVIFDDTYALLHHVEAAIVKSGTATLETALFNVPQVVCYKTNRLTFAIGKRLVKVKYVSLVNLILEKESVKELLQDNLNYQNIKSELKKLLDPNYKEAILKDYEKLKKLIGEKGASDRVAAKMINYLKEL
ncbi:MAG: lipid-A-disaccharide synthase [Bacteroidales bacterium]